MKAFLINTGMTFGTLARVLRVIAEGAHRATDLVFHGLTLLAAALCSWVWIVHRKLPGS